MTREEAKEILTHNWTRVDNPNYSESELDEAIDMAIEALLAERVIRCKDCRYYNNDYMGKWCGRHQAPVWVKEEDFCSWAKMKGNIE